MGGLQTNAAKNGKKVENKRNNQKSVNKLDPHNFS
jgi:hypothetical protein